MKAQTEKPEATDAEVPGGAGAKALLPRNRLRDAIVDLDEGGVAPNFGRARRGAPGTKISERTQARVKTEDASFEPPDDLIAAARRAAHAAALKVEERGSITRARKLPGDGETAQSGEFPARRKRSFLIISAAVLLAISAMLLYSRLSSKPDFEVVPPTVQQSAPPPAASSEDPATAGADEEAPAAAEPEIETPPAPPAGASELQPETEAGRSEDAVGEASRTGNFTDVVKSYRPAAANNMLPQAEPAALKITEAPSLPPGVVFAVEDPTLDPQSAAATPSPTPIPQSLPLPPAGLWPLP
jgi:localization factor PodJL